MKFLHLVLVKYLIWILNLNLFYLKRIFLLFSLLIWQNCYKTIKFLLLLLFFFILILILNQKIFLGLTKQKFVKIYLTLLNGQNHLIIILRFQKTFYSRPQISLLIETIVNLIILSLLRTHYTSLTNLFQLSSGIVIWS
jgi:hypothetical protein